MLSREATYRDFDVEALAEHLPLHDWAQTLIHQNTQTAFFRRDDRCYVAWSAGGEKARDRILDNLSSFHLPVAQPLTLLTFNSANISFGVLPRGALPLADVLSECNAAAMRERLNEALAGLLVHLHLAGFHFRMGVMPKFAIRRDEDDFTAFLMNAMDGELLDDQLDFRRAMDLQSTANVLESAWRECSGDCNFEEVMEDTEQVNDFLDRYRIFWNNISHAAVFCDDQAMITTRVVARKEAPRVLDMAGGFGFRLRTRIVHPKHHKMMLHMLTGLVTAGNRGARKLLADINRYRSWLEFSSGRKWSKALAANHWMNEVYDPAVNLLPRPRKMATV